MKFGKLEDISNVDFSLPSEPKKNEDIFSGLTSSKTELFVGCTAWSSKEWKGSFYPSNIKAKDFLKEYAKQFNSIELNSTHYGTPTSDTLQKWYDSTPMDFIFCPKIHKAISHRKSLGMDSDIIENTMNALSIFNEKLGPCFMQLPPYYDSSRIDQLKEFFEVFPSEFDLSIELRHDSWFSDPVLLDELQDMASTYDKGLLITDVAGRRDVLHMRICGDYLMIRFVGNASKTELHPTDYYRIDEWINKMSSMGKRGLEKIYFFSHEPDNILAPQLADYLCKRITELTNIKTRGPKKIIQDQQLNLF